MKRRRAKAMTRTARRRGTTTRLDAGDVVSVRDIARILSEVSGERYRPLRAGSLGMFAGRPRREVDMLLAA